MTYRIEGLAPEGFAPLFAMDDEALAAINAVRMTAGEGTYPCRVSLQLARPGETMVLANYASHDVPGPFRTAYAIYVREEAVAPEPFVDRMPPLLDARTLSLRAWDRQGMLRNARLAEPGEGDAIVRELLEDEAVASIHAHNAAFGCFLAAIERTGVEGEAN